MSNSPEAIVAPRTFLHRLPAIACGILACASAAQGADPSSRARAVRDIAEEYFEDTLRLTPSLATRVGDTRYNDKLENNATKEFHHARAAMARRHLDRLKQIDASKLDEPARVSLESLLFDLRIIVDGERFPLHVLPIHQMASTADDFARFAAATGGQPFSTIEDYERFLTRCRDFERWARSAVSSMREGMRIGVTHPRPVVERFLPLLRSLASGPVENSVFWTPARTMPQSWSAADRERVTRAWRDAVGGKVLPALSALATFVEKEYLPAARTSVSWEALPDGEAWYRHAVRQETTIDLSPDEAHETGLAQVARLRKSMDEVRKQVGFQGDLRAFFDYFRNDSRFRYPSGDAMLDAYRELKVRVDARLPALFDPLPRTSYVIQPFESFRASGVPAAQYQGPPADGSRPGIFYVNTRDLAAHPNYIRETLLLHEAGCGHHLQIALSRELPDLPRFRQFKYSAAYADGWAIYCESLGTSLGLYDDPYQWYGHLTDDMLRAMRLVVDSGLHRKGWTREQAIQYMIENSSVAESEVRLEVDRYIAWPGQALAYKTGQFTIVRLREEAERALGARFDLRRFHAQVLGTGTVPLAALEGHVRRWIETQRAAPDGT